MTAKIDLKQYLTEKALQEMASGIKEPGPVITISRESGCGAVMIAEQLTQVMNNLKKSAAAAAWSYVNKEIIDESAKELGLPPSKIEYVFNAEKRGMFDEMLAAMSDRYYKSDRLIKKTVMEVIKSIGEKGYVVIIGRGGVALTRHIKKSLHIKLYAPLDYRIQNVSKRFQLTLKEAEKYVADMDYKRDLLVKEFLGAEPTHAIYDVMYNVQNNSNQAIIDSMVQLVKAKEMI